MINNCKNAKRMFAFKIKVVHHKLLVGIYKPKATEKRLFIQHLCDSQTAAGCDIDQCLGLYGWDFSNHSDCCQPHATSSQPMREYAFFPLAASGCQTAMNQSLGLCLSKPKDADMKHLSDECHQSLALMTLYSDIHI